MQGYSSIKNSINDYSHLQSTKKTIEASVQRGIKGPYNRDVCNFEAQAQKFARRTTGRDASKKLLVLGKAHTANVIVENNRSNFKKG